MASTTGRQKNRRDPGKRRDEIVDAGVRLAVDHGLDRLTVRDVAAEVGVAPGLLHHYYPQIDGLIVAVFRKVVAADLDWLHSDLAAIDPEQAVRVFLKRSVAASRDTALSMWLGAWVAASRRPGLQKVVTELMEEGVARLAEIITKGTASGVFICDDPKASAKRILIVRDGILIQRTIQPGEVERLSLDAFVAATAERELNVTLR